MQIDRRSIGRMAIGGFMLFLLIYYYMFVGDSLLNACKPMILGICIAYPLNIMINWFDKHEPLYKYRILKNEKAHRVLCTALAVVVLAVCLVVIFGYLAPQLTACIITLLDKVPSGIRFW